MFNHEPFEDFMDYVPDEAARARRHLPRRDGGDRRAGLGSRDGPAHRRASRSRSPAGHVQQLHERRCDLLDTNLDLLDDIGGDNDANASVMSKIHANRRSTEALNRVFNAYSDTITT